MTNKMMPFDFDGNQVRVQLDEHGEPLFIAVDVCRCLDHSNPRQAIRSLDDDEKGVIECYTPGGQQQLRAVTEAGLYKLVLRSNCKKAKSFQRWVIHEVLPSIRKTGSYGTTQINVRDAAQLAPIALQLIEYTNELKAALAEAQPKVEGYDELINTDGLRGLQEAGKALGLKPRSFTKLLEKEGYIFRTSNDNLMPNQRYKDLGYFEVRSFVKNGESRSQAFVTRTGLDYFWRKFCSQSQQLCLRGVLRATKE